MKNIRVVLIAGALLGGYYLVLDHRVPLWAMFVAWVFASIHGALIYREAWEKRP